MPALDSTPPEKNNALLTSSQIAARIGSRYQSTIHRTIRRLGIEPDARNSGGFPLYHESRVEAIRRATADGVPADHLTSGQMSRQIGCDNATVRRILSKKLEIPPDYTLPRGTFYWHKDRIPLVTAQLRNKIARP